MAKPPADVPATGDDSSNAKLSDNVPAADSPSLDTTTEADTSTARPPDDAQDGDMPSGEAVPESVPSGDAPSTDAPADNISNPRTKRKGSKSKK